MRRFRSLVILLCASTFVIASRPMASDESEQQQYEGSLGTSSIGMTLLHTGSRIDGGHYFYQKFLQDIPLSGKMESSEITLNEPDGSIFHLHFIGNGSEGGHPLDFNNSVGMRGTWTNAKGTRSYKVSLHGTEIRPGRDEGRRYADVTSESDEKFETRVQHFVRSVETGNKDEALLFITYPLRVNYPDRTNKLFRTRTEVLDQWNEVFTPALLSHLRRDLPHDMFVHEGNAMLGDGDFWFDSKGLVAVNLPRN